MIRLGRTRFSWKLLLLLALMALVATGCPRADDTAGRDGTRPAAETSLLDEVVSRGMVICGVNDRVPGFGFLTPAGEFEGFDVLFCRALAAAVLGDATKVEFKALTAEQRFTALQAGEVDVLIRNTTWTATRDGSEGAAFTTTTFYDGQGMMVRADSRVRTLEDMRNTTICVLSGTTTELNLDTQFRARGIPYTPQPFETNDPLREAFIQGRCDGWTSDKSQLAGIRSAWAAADGGPAALRILEVTMSKEPLGPVVKDGDQKWFDAVNWAVIATIQAEEFGITQANVDQIRSESQDPEVQRFLGVEVEGSVFDPGLGLPADFAYQIIKQVGSYADIYNGTVGPATPLGLERGVNALWTDGGLLYPPPYR